MTAGPRRAGAWLPLLGAALFACGAWAQAKPPPAGRHAGEMCVRTGDGAPQCGPVELEFRKDRLRVQASDIAYRLTLRSSQADVVLVHGAMQVDEFVADYRWLPQALQFDDPDKGVRYEVRWVGKRR